MQARYRWWPSGLAAVLGFAALAPAPPTVAQWAPGYGGPYGGAVSAPPQVCSQIFTVTGMATAYGPWLAPPEPTPAFYALPPFPVPFPALVPYPWYPWTPGVSSESVVCPWQPR